MQFTLSFRTPIFLNMDTAKSNAVYQKYFDQFLTILGIMTLLT